MLAAVVRELRRRRVRSALTATGIAIGVAALVLLGALAEKMDRLVSGGRDFAPGQITASGGGGGGAAAGRNPGAPPLPGATEAAAPGDRGAGGELPREGGAPAAAVHARADGVRRRHDAPLEERRRAAAADRDRPAHPEAGRQRGGDREPGGEEPERRRGLDDHGPRQDV